MRTKIYITILAMALFITGCSKDFLETEPSEFISSEQIGDASEINPGLQAANINGIYSLMYTAGSGGTNLRHTDYGQKGWDVFMDMLAADMVLAGTTYGWHSDIANYTAPQDFTTLPNQMPWVYYYKIIFSANNVIDQLGGNEAELETAEARNYMGQAKTMRAHSYFYLANLYAEGYNPSESILPIYLDTEVPNQPLSPASEVYNVIVSDLTDAIELLQDFSRPSKSAVNQWVAKGLLAYAYAAMGEDAQVKEITQDIITNGGFPIMSANEVVATVDEETIDLENDFLGEATGGGFNDVTNPSWMWGVDLTLDSGLDLVSWWGQIDVTTYSYAYVGDEKTIDIGLYNAIPEGDVRKDQFVNIPGIGGDNQLVPTNKFFAPARTLGGQRYIETDYVYMRIAEMYLLNAEASAKTGDEATAKQSLKALLSERMDDVSYIDGLSGQALLDEIYLQTRIELWGEGKSYLAMKRNEATITRGANHLFLAGQSFPYNADELTLEIPEAEILNNPQISAQ